MTVLDAASDDRVVEKYCDDESVWTERIVRARKPRRVRDGRYMDQFTALPNIWGTRSRI